MNHGESLKVNPLFLSDFSKTWFSRHIFDKSLNTKFHQKPSTRSRVVSDEQADMTKLAVAFRKFCERA